EKILGRTEDIQHLEFFWKLYVKRFVYKENKFPLLTTEMLRCGRKNNVEDLINSIKSGNKKIKIISDSIDEGKAFVYSALESTKELKEKYLIRSVILYDDKGINNVINDLQLYDNCILVLGCETQHIQTLMEKNIVIELSGDNVSDKQDGDIVLNRFRSDEFVESTKDQEIPEAQLEFLGIACFGSITLLEYLPCNNQNRPSNWVDDKFIGASLANMWNNKSGSQYKDRDFMNNISLQDEYTKPKSIKSILKGDNSPIIKKNNIIKVKSPIALFACLSSSNEILEDYYDMLEKNIINVFSDLTEKYSGFSDIGISEDMPLAHLSNKDKEYSDHLRKGLAMSLLCISVINEEKNVLDGKNGREFVNDIMKKIPQLNEKINSIASLSDNLDILFEASPDFFIKILHRIIQEKPELLTERNLYCNQLYHHFIRSLYILAFLPEYFDKVCDIFCKMHEVYGDIKIGPTAIQQLQDLFILWNPQTDTKFELRQEKLRKIIQDYPDIGWKIILHILPEDFLSVTPNQRPRIRVSKNKENTVPKIMTCGEIWAEYDEVYKLAIENINNLPERWGNIIEKITNFTACYYFCDKILPELQNKLNETIKITDNNVKNLIWKKIDKKYNQHKIYDGTYWSIFNKENLKKTKNIKNFIEDNWKKLQPKNYEELELIKMFIGSDTEYKTKYYKLKEFERLQIDKAKELLNSKKGQKTINNILEVKIDEYNYNNLPFALTQASENKEKLFEIFKNICANKNIQEENKISFIKSGFYKYGEEWLNLSSNIWKDNNDNLILFMLEIIKIYILIIRIICVE
ncbi:MAG: hypothetical protein P8N25_05560, partial [Alphaproteobacteria bacterium]|nr:hypothetical protein [Alphaproteobacteria bacterium]